MKQPHHYQQLIHLFDQCFRHRFNSILVKGESEPIYLPADEDCPYHQIVFAHGFYASALHEISHWCIAGTERRKLIDYGYWYCADGRDKQTQSQFEAVEIKPQALEWIFSVAAGFPFNISCDNLDGDYEPDRQAFQQQVHTQVIRYLSHPLAERANCFVQALQQFYRTPALKIEHFIYPQCEIVSRTTRTKYD